jgi:hypothetical protein
VKIPALISATALTAILAGGCNEHPVKPKSNELKLKSNYSVEQARTFHGFALYYAGNEVAGLPLTAVSREPVTAPPGTAVAKKLRGTRHVSSFDFIYGSCVIPKEPEVCNLPLDIQLWPACARFPALYNGSLSPVPKPTRIRGVPAAYFGGGNLIEIQTGDATIMIFGRRRLTREAVNALEGLNVRVAAGDKLPPPVRGALDGTLACS